MQSLRRRAGRAAAGCAVLGTLALLACLLAGSLLYAGVVSDLPSLSILPQLLDPQNGLYLQPTRVYDRSGQKLLLSLDNPGISRHYLYLDALQTDHFSPELVRVTVGALDPGFWGSPGVDLKNLTNPEAHTIAERLVNDLLLAGETPGLRRTLRMKLLAVQVISRYGQVQVLEWYLNSAYYGHLAYGASSAARLYLDASASGIDLPQAALLTAAVEAPALNPLDAPQVAQERQQAILNRLVVNRVISSEEYLRAATVKLRIAQAPAEQENPARVFSGLVLERLSAAIGRERLERGGLKVITTLDYDLQIELACLVETQVSRLTGRARSQPEESLSLAGGQCQSARLLPTLPPADEPLGDALMASAVVLDPQTGQVLALLGDMTLQGETAQLAAHEPGSILTPFAAVASFARGIGPASLGWDIPSSLPDELFGRQNPDDTFHGPVRLRQALANDYLAAQAGWIEQVGAQNVWRLASAMGLSDLAEEKSAGLIYGGGSVSPLDLAQAYGVLAVQGSLSGQKVGSDGSLQPGLVLYVEDSNQAPVLDWHVPETQAVVSSQLAYLVHDILSDVTARRPSLGSPNALEIGRPSGAKVGSVEGGKQAWAAGYTTRRVAVFWLGLPEDNAQQVDKKMVAGMWHALMQYANRGLTVEDWSEPEGITHVDVCDPSGLLPTGACPEIVREIFLSGSEPTAPDNLYQKVQINRETGRLATVFTPASLVEEKIYMVVPYAAEAWAKAAGLPVPPKEYDAVQPPEPSAGVEIASPALYSFLRGEVTVTGTAAGDGFRFYQLLVGQGLNPQTWLQVGEDGTFPVTGGQLGRWDTTGLEGLYTIRLLVVREEQTLEMATIQVTVDNTAPLVRILYPLAGQEIRVKRGADMNFQAEVSDTLGLGRVVWLVDGTQAGESVQAPYVFSWPARSGEHTLQVKAYDLAGNEGVSEEVVFKVVSP